MKIITVGKANSQYADNIKTYSKRLQANFKIEWINIPHSSFNQPKQALKQESDHILNKVRPNDYLILLDQTGRNLSSPELSQVLTTKSNIVIVIGGAYGVNKTVKQRANLIWSLSNLVFPHQLVRLILTEQIYRAQTITQNHPYHH